MAIYKGSKKIAGLIRGEDISHATETHAGIIEIATQGEVLGGASDSKAVTPTKLKQYYYDKINMNALLAEKQPVGDYATNTALTDGLATKQDVIDDLEEIRSNAQAGKDIIPQVNVNTQRIEELTTAKFPNVIIKGTPHIVGGQVSGFSNTNYLQFPFTDISHGRPFKFRFSFTTGDNVTRQQNILDSYFGLALAIQNSRGIMALSSNGSTWDIGMATGTVDLSPHTTYYVEYGFTGTEYTTAISLNKESYVPDMRLPSNKALHVTTTYIGGSPDLFGASTAHPFEGSINFNDSEVEVQTDLGWLVVWEGMADVGFATRANVSLSNLDDAGEARFNVKANVTDLTAHTSNGTIHVTANDKITWNQKVNQNQLLEYGSELDYADDTLSLLNTSGDVLSSVNIKSTPDLDNLSIKLNRNSQLQTVAVINQNNTTTAIKTWTGTKAQYDAIANKNAYTLYNITDDTDVSLTILEALYPVGSVYETTNATCPLSSLISGSTWVQEPSRVLVDKHVSGTEWYNLYSDGWCEQGGQIIGTTSGTLTYLKPYKDTNYTIFMHGVGTYAGTITGNGMFNPRTRTASSCTYYQDSNISTIMWQACGYTSTTTSHKQFRRTA